MNFCNIGNFLFMKTLLNCYVSVELKVFLSIWGSCSDKLRPLCLLGTNGRGSKAHADMSLEMSWRNSQSWKQTEFSGKNSDTEAMHGKQIKERARIPRRLVRFWRTYGSQTCQERRKGFPGIGNSMCEGTEVWDKAELAHFWWILGRRQDLRRRKVMQCVWAKWAWSLVCLRVVLYDSWWVSYLENS